MRLIYNIRNKSKFYCRSNFWVFEFKKKQPFEVNLTSLKESICRLYEYRNQSTEIKEVERKHEQQFYRNY
jgi:hypothetical protein